MNDLELLNYAEMKLDEAIRSGNAYKREFWRGYVQGLKVRNTTTVHQYGENCTHIENCGTLTLNL